MKKLFLGMAFLSVTAAQASPECLNNNEKIISSAIYGAKVALNSNSRSPLALDSGRGVIIGAIKDPSDSSKYVAQVVVTLHGKDKSGETHELAGLVQVAESCDIYDKAMGETESGQ